MTFEKCNPKFVNILNEMLFYWILSHVLHYIVFVSVFMSNCLILIEFSQIFHDKRSHVVSELKKLQTDTEPIIKIFEVEEVNSMIQTTRDGRTLFEYLNKNHGVCFWYFILNIKLSKPISMHLEF